MGIHNVQMYESVVKSMAKQKVTLEILSYHATAPVEEAEKFAQAGEKFWLLPFDFS